MIAMYRRTFITKILFDILSNIISAKIEGIQSTTDIFPIYNYTITLYTTSLLIFN